MNRKRGPVALGTQEIKRRGGSAGLQEERRQAGRREAATAAAE